MLLPVPSSASTLSSPTPSPLLKKLSLCLRAASSTCNITPSTYTCSLRLHNLSMPVPCHAEVMTCNVIAVISLACHKIWNGKQTPGVSDQTYFSLHFPRPLRNTHAHIRVMSTSQYCIRMYKHSLQPLYTLCAETF